MAILNYLATGLKALGLARGVATELKAARAYLGKTRIRFTSIQDLSTAFFRDELAPGQRIRVEAVPSRFSHFYRPRIRLPVLPGDVGMPRPVPHPKAELTFSFGEATPTEVTVPAGLQFHWLGERLNPRIVEGTRGHVALRLPHLPAAALPPLRIDESGDTATRHLAFLYPINSRGLVAVGPTVPGGDFFVPDDSVGIPIVVPDDVDYRSYAESTCVVEGVIRTAPHTILDVLTDTPLALRRRLSRLFYKADAPTRKGFYIEAERFGPPESPDTEVGGFQATLFIESHLPNMRFESIADLVQSYTLDNFGLLTREIGDGFSPGLIGLQDSWSLGLRRGNIVVDGPNSVGFYVPTDLRGDGTFTSDYNYLRTMFSEFSTATEVLATGLRQKFGTGARGGLTPSFMFDYECQYDICESGVLSDADSATTIESDPSLRDVATWLNSGLK